MKPNLYKQVLSALLLLQVLSTSAQINIYPSNWWVGMRWNKVQLLLHVDNEDNPSSKQAYEFNAAKISTSHAGITITKVTPFPNKRYLAVDLTIASNAAPGNVVFKIQNNNKTTDLIWRLESKRQGNGTAYAQGVQPKDFIYLLMPDRFSNGDISNDVIKNTKDKTLNRDSIFHRHGGDLQGVINKLDYLQNLGVTALWMTPIFLNDMPNRTEHGYAATNHYEVDYRLGNNDLYKKLSHELHKRNMKLIQDAVYNHVGIEHFFVKDSPMPSWLNQWPSFTQTSYRDQVLFDPHAALSQTQKMHSGWFTREMPDLNQNNPFVANFLIQHALWSVENFGVDGFRIDTYAYNDLNFMNKCNAALIAEYPKLTLYGETWMHGVVNQSFFCENNFNAGFKSNLQNTTDFQTLFYGIQAALTQKQGWTEGVTQLYNTAAQDFVYKNPQNQVIFLDNHDLPRFFSVLNEDAAKYKMALGWLLTFRGIPQLYYGDEIAMTGFTNPDGNVRLDFKGGWAEDKTNKFTKEGRTEMENEIHSYITTLAKFRQTASAITNGKLMQYLPENGLYTYFRYNGTQTIMCIMNTGDETMEINAAEKYSERCNGFGKMRNVITKEVSGLKLNIKPKQMLIAELVK
jgi:neopullulanase